MDFITKTAFVEGRTVDELVKALQLYDAIQKLAIFLDSEDDSHVELASNPDRGSYFANNFLNCGEDEQKLAVKDSLSEAIIALADKVQP